ncbi:uncharacterized protein PHALS_07976 [Plasmopara halstedii]|uniref:Uncharacterized protein n=1 Tax=Plasmopara halstedii TaxID=4781 RepID=A0A0P1B622_PLAHL|nr:uncharacterized protein PHALS_07976 [Plasmopara halstedii]CEG50252.1 hypothetical protein PHALS_07976 [Plasmopara halstedii]|eukprot:XP_024586621.1 hypothetical protein PHALS_07976 [Plasmopara halstedii]
MALDAIQERQLSRHSTSLRVYRELCHARTHASVKKTSSPVSKLENRRAPTNENEVAPHQGEVEVDGIICCMHRKLLTKVIYVANTPALTSSREKGGIIVPIELYWQGRALCGSFL